MINEIVTLMFLVLLQAVLGLDNLLYISLESKRAPKADRARVRKIGIAIAVIARIVLLIILLKLIEHVQAPWISFDNRFIEGTFNLHSVIVLLGGVFIMYTAVKEIWHMVSIEKIGHAIDDKPKSPKSVIAMIALMNLVFSFDSILSAMALTKTLWVMATAIVIGGLLMIWLADRVSGFLEKNRMYEALGLFVLLIVGVMLLSEGGHLAHLKLFGGEIHAMSKATFYFVITVLILTDLVQSRYQRKLLRKKNSQTNAL